VTAVADRPDNPVDALADLFDTLDTHVAKVATTAKLDDRNRISLLFGHGVFGALVGPGFVFLAKTGMAAPTFVVLRKVPGAPISLAVWITVAGVALAVATWRRHHLAEYVALAAMTAWYAVTFASFVGAIILWLGAAGPPDWGRAPSMYAPVIYAHLCYTLSAHMWTIRRKGLRRDAR